MWIKIFLLHVLVGFVLDARATTLTQVEQRVAILEKKLEHGGKDYQRFSTSEYLAT